MNDKPKKETARAYRAFLAYRDMPQPRSLRRLAEEMVRERHKPSTVHQQTFKSEAYAASLFRQLATWSSTFNWQERCKQYDEEQAALRRVQYSELAITALLRHLQADVSPSAHSQIKAAQLVLEHLVVSEEIATLKAQQEKLSEALKKLGVALE
ncbi:hypothetical protein EI42_06012 [Thermosporothrix hazakensis]|jgi:hypothetical protein|uniref:Uncharacterized protein n=2 Tax=Thermosporothrix TaxID=768650 RepID=A0A326TSZ9_THEHA|nr:hypothetical protein [Thermosporothrix hazakensis]BBH90152.1 hypothetical protein KTC_49030 [Thermosporothrix sp. COM3]PZW19703.1 hypothetical protein EI42_06012 [Thermosporothrix hazakensis]BBH90217.1 hypothetical protein KTC_49680 [Thermosporothrix sp. COM3]BBH90282.1 hypothetical protein KTC_50330 [Thermosporothrix sp. COM3]GCE49185.1 hypothetical protein KTH_40540 [Thermosporothrix hazakensis]